MPQRPYYSGNEPLSIMDLICQTVDGHVDLSSMCPGDPKKKANMRA